MCQVLGVKRQNYYAWIRRQAAYQPDPNREKKIALVRKAAMESGFTYGTRRIKKSLADHHYPVSRGEARRLMKAAKVEVRQRKKFKVTTNSKHNKRVYDNVLDRHFRVERPNQVYVGDITYIWTNEGWLYLAVIIDLYSRKVVGWSMDKRMTARLACDALTMAIWRRKPAQGLIVHSDQGSQYASYAYRRLIDKNGFTGSMSRKGNCWDNAVAESFFGTLKQERVQWRHYQTRQEAIADIREYIVMYYNEKRLHSYLGYMSPNDCEREFHRLQKAA